MPDKGRFNLAIPLRNRLLVLPSPKMPGRFENDGDARLDELFRDYHAACQVVEESRNFMPDLWAKIDARRVSTSWFGWLARVLVTAGLAASAILGTVISSANQSSVFFDGTFVEALQAEYASTLEPLHLDRIAALQP
jgi:hypothetical protein